MVDRKIVEYSNLQLSEGNGHWCASWERGGRHLNTDELYGCSQKRSFAILKRILEEDHGIVIPPEIAVKSMGNVQYDFNRKIYTLDEKALNPEKGINGAHKHAPIHNNRACGDYR